MKHIVIALLLFGAIVLTAVVDASAEQGPSEEELKKANNPLANIKAFNIQNYYIPTLSSLPDKSANTAWLRYAQPIKRVLLRVSLPINTVPTADPDYTSGLGDGNIFGAYLISDPTSPNQFGLGPLVGFPSATDDVLGSGKWQLGAAAVGYFAKNPVWQYGGLLTWQASVSGDEDRDDTNLLVAQPFSFWQLGGGTYLRTAPLWVFNLEKETYNVPIGFGIGKIVKVGNTVFNVFIEPQYTVLQRGVGQPQFQIYTAVNMQFFPKPK